MTRLLPLVAAFLTLSSVSYRAPVRYEIPAPVQAFEIPGVPAEHVATFISAANSYGLPVEYLAAIPAVETSMGTDLAHRNPLDRGWFGLHERPEIHAERAAMFGEYDPDHVGDSARIAAGLLAMYRERFGSWDLAFTAYHRGAAWTARHGRDPWYLSRIKAYLCGTLH